MKPELTYELLKELYIDKNMSSGKIAKQLGYGKTWIGKKLKQFGLQDQKSEEDRNKAKYQNMANTNLEKYGSISPFGSKEIQEKAQNTLKRSYGVDHPLKSSLIKEKIKGTMKERYGVDHALQSNEFKEKSKQTCLEKYGVDNYSKTNEFKKDMSNTWKQEGYKESIQEKTKSTNIKKYGKHYSQTDEYKEKVKQTNIEKFGTDNYAKTSQFKEDYKAHCLEKYGVDNIAKTSEVQKKMRNTMKERYGVEAFSQTLEWKEHLIANHDEIENKKYNTKKQNNTFNTSQPEEKAYALLVEHFSENDVLRQYKSPSYPYPCDFYIKSLDLYIEYQGTWCHGNEPYNPNNRVHQEIVNKWSSKHTEYSDYAVKIWTERDPEKRKIAKENNLNWKEFFSMDELSNWLNSL